MKNRWGQLVVGIVCMATIANLQYGWTLFVNPIADAHHWTRAAIQVAFTVFILTETWLVPVEGWLVDRFGPRIVVVAGGVMVGAAWMVNAAATSLPVLYLGAVVGGIGAGSVYGTCIGNALKWFPDRRGLAAGLTSMGFGAGAALTVVPIANSIRLNGYEATFLRFGLIQGLVVFAAGWLLRRPGPEILSLAPARGAQAHGSRDFTLPQMVRTPVFWVLYIMFVLMATGGLVATAQLASIAHDFGAAESPVRLAGLTLPALIFALSIDRLLNGVTRPFFGWLSDFLGRENTMGLAFALEAVAILALSRYGTDPVAFVLLSGLVFFAYGEIYSLFPATCGDCFGSRNATANAGLLYTAKGFASLMVPLTSLIAGSAGGWRIAFATAGAMNVAAALLALVVLKPLRAHLQAGAISAVAEARPAS
ncbi:MAG TPA: oxalate/formate MFS antiporter [Gemmatimonadales bacterium]